MTTLHTVGVGTQPQMVSHNPQQQIAYQTVQAQPQPTTNIIYNASGSRQTGYGQVICSVLSVAVGIAAIVLDCSYAYIASPIWSGIGFFLVAGILGIAAAGNQSNCLIISHLVMSILASVIAFQMMCVMTVAALVEDDNCRYVYDIFGPYSSHCEKYYGRIVVDGIGGLVALTEFIIAIIAAAICCRGGLASGVVATQQMVVHHYVPNQGNLTIMTNPQSYGQTVTAQPGYIQPQAYPVHAYNNQAFNVAPRTSQGIPSLPPPGAPPDLPPPYKYDDEKAGGLPMPDA